MEDQIKAVIRGMLGGGDNLGFCDPPTPLVVYANRQYPDCLWYTWDFDGNKHNPILKRAIKCVVVGIEVAEKEFRNKVEKKLRVKVQTDRSYVIESGLGTQFANGLIASLDTLGSNITKPIVIEAEAGETDTVLFCRVYLNGESVRTPKHEDIDFVNSIGRIALALDGASLPPAQVTPPVKPVVKSAPIEPAKEETIEYDFTDDEQPSLLPTRSQSEWSAIIKGLTIGQAKALRSELAADDLGPIKGQLLDNFDDQLNRLNEAKATLVRHSKALGISAANMSAKLGKPSADCTLAELSVVADSIAPAKELSEIAF